MKPLIVLLVVFIAGCLASLIAVKNPDYYLCARVAMTVMLVFTSIAHFKFTRGMMLMLPRFVPYKKPVVYVTGIIEILAGIGLLVAPVRHTVAWLVIIFFVILLPANIYAARHAVDLERANYKGRGLTYLWFRVPLQLFFIAWVYYFAVLN
jgi:uncharacterized membrane protein